MASKRVRSIYGWMGYDVLLNIWRKCENRPVGNELAFPQVFLMFLVCPWNCMLVLAIAITIIKSSFARQQLIVLHMKENAV